jgi:hypothetical protein
MPADKLQHFNFYAPWPNYGLRLPDNWVNSRQNFNVLNPIVEAAIFDKVTNIKDSGYQGSEFGDKLKHNRFRAISDSSDLRWKLQTNTSTEANPTWESVLEVKPTGEIDSFYITNLIDVKSEPDSYRTSEINFNPEDFYITPTSGNNPMVNIDKDHSMFLRDPICLTERAEPATPPATEVKIWAEDVSGDTTPIRVKDSSGIILTMMQDQTYVVRNNSGSDMTAGQLVYISGATGNTPTVALARANSVNTTPAFGVTLEPISNNSFGKVMINGIIENVNTNGLGEGTELFLSTSSAGEYQTAQPAFPNIEQKVGNVLVDGTGNGSVLVNIVSPEDHISSVTDGLNNYDHPQRLNFAGTDFYVSRSSTGTPTVNLGISRDLKIGGDFEADVATFEGINITNDAHVDNTLTVGGDFYAKGDVTVKGEFLGARLLFTAGEDGLGLSGVGTSKVLNIHNVPSTTLQGTPVPRGGYIVGVAARINITAHGGGTTTARVRAQVNGTVNAISADVSVTGISKVNAYATQARGVSVARFEAGDYVNLRVLNPTGGQTIDTAIAMAEIQFDN